MIVRILLVPLTVRQIHSMQNLQAHAPEMKEIQQKWKHDKQRQNEELMKFYQENKINPAASCLPIVLQIPIFISLFFVLRDFEERGAAASYPASSRRLARPRRHHRAGEGRLGPAAPRHLRGSQLSSSYFMSTTMQDAQRVLLMVLPVVFVPFILNFPAGLMLYWLTTNLWTTGPGPRHPPADAEARRRREKRSSRTPPKDEPPPHDGAGSGAAARRSRAGRRPASRSPARRGA